MEEESVSKRIDRVEEMTIPSDLEDKLGYVTVVVPLHSPTISATNLWILRRSLSHVRQKIVPMIEAWQKICVLGERLIRKREAAAVRSTNTRPSFVPHLRLPPALRVSSPLSSPLPSPSLSYSTSADAADSTPRMPFAFASSLSPALSTAQADLSRLTNTLKTLVEMNAQCWKGQDCDLSEGVRQGISVVSAHTQRHADLLELRVRDDSHRSDRCVLSS